MSISRGILSSSITNGDPSGGSVTCTMVGLTAHSAIILLIAASSGMSDPGAFTVSDDAGGTWVGDITPGATNGGGVESNRGAVWRRQDVGASPPGTLTISIATNGNVGRVGARAREVIGLAASPLDGSASGSGNSTSAAPSTYTTSGAGDFIIFGLTWDADHGAPTFTPPGGAYTEDLNFAGSKPSISILDNLQNALGGATGFTPTWSIGGTVHWGAIAIGYIGSTATAKTPLALLMSGAQ